MKTVQPKKWLGQHFLTEPVIASRIVDLLQPNPEEYVLEIGPGKGILTQYLVKMPNALYAIEVDDEAADYIQSLPAFERVQLIRGDVLKQHLPPGQCALIGNLPYNISSPILFWLLDNRLQIPKAVFMMQQEVAKRIASPPGNKERGILSVLIDTYYAVDYAFRVEPGSFFPPPKVQSGVIRLRQRDTDYENFTALKTVVKTAFNQRRKTLHNALKSLNFELPAELASLRAEQLTTQQFHLLTSLFVQASARH